MDLWHFELSKKTKVPLGREMLYFLRNEYGIEVENVIIFPESPFFGLNLDQNSIKVGVYQMILSRHQRT